MATTARARTRTITGGGVTALAVMMGCGPSAIDDGGGTGSATSGSSGSSSSSIDGTSASTTIDGATTSDGTSTGDGTTTGDPTDTTDGTSTGDPACAPPEDVAVSFVVSPDESLSATCIVLGATLDPEESLITLGCDGQVVSLSLSTSPASHAPQLAEGQTVHIDHVVDTIFWMNRWLALRSAGGESDWLLLAGVASSQLDPPGTTLDAFLGGGSFGAPTVTPVTGLCPPIDDDCGPRERIALDFGLDVGASVQVLDHATGLIDILAYGFAFTVEHASLYPRPQSCDDVPPGWLEFTMVWFPSD